MTRTVLLLPWWKEGNAVSRYSELRQMRLHSFFFFFFLLDTFTPFLSITSLCPRLNFLGPYGGAKHFFFLPFPNRAVWLDRRHSTINVAHHHYRCSNRSITRQQCVETLQGCGPSVSHRTCCLLIIHFSASEKWEIRWAAKAITDHAVSNRAVDPHFEGSQ